MWFAVKYEDLASWAGSGPNRTQPNPTQMHPGAIFNKSCNPSLRYILTLVYIIF